MQKSGCGPLYLLSVLTVFQAQLRTYVHSSIHSFIHFTSNENTCTVHALFKIDLEFNSYQIKEKLTNLYIFYIIILVYLS